MKTSANDDRDFANKFLEELKDDIFYAIRRVLEPDSAKIVIDWVGDNFQPEDIFNEEQLSEWAKSHGYIKENNDTQAQSVL